MEFITGERERGLVILDQVRMGIIPAEWRVITANRGYLRGQGILYSISATFVLSIGGLFAFSSIKKWATLGELNWFNIFSAVIFLLTGGDMMAIAISHFHQVAHVKDQQLIFMPNGVVEYGVKATPASIDHIIFYDQVARVYVKRWLTGGHYRREHRALAFDMRDGSTVDWVTSNRFGSQEEIAERVITDFAHYQALHP